MKNSLFHWISKYLVASLLLVGVNDVVYALSWGSISAGKAVPVRVTASISDTITRTYINGYQYTDCSGTASSLIVDTAPSGFFSITSGTHTYFLGVTPNFDSACDGHSSQFTSVPCLLCPNGITLGSIKFNFVNVVSGICQWSCHL